MRSAKFNRIFFYLSIFTSVTYFGSSYLLKASESTRSDPWSGYLFAEKWANDEQWIWQAHLAAPDYQVTESGEIRFTISGLENDCRMGYPSLPFYVKLINALPEEISYQIQSKNLQLFSLPANIEKYNDIFVPDLKPAAENGQSVRIPDIYPAEQVRISFAGYVNNLPLTRITIYPYQLISSNQKLKYYEDLKVTVSIKKSGSLKTITQIKDNPLIANLGLEGKILRATALPMAKTVVHPLFGKKLIRIVVEKDGIYRLSRKTLLDDGALGKNVDPRTFQLFNRGLEVPIYVAGESDGEFNQSDYLEFYGQRNRNTVADYEYDPFTDKNVYFLTWGEREGQRYTEESAKSTVASNQAINPTDYDYTLHYEENKHFENLGQVDTNLPTHTRDHWFFNSGINGGTTQSFYFSLTNPNKSSALPFQIEVGMHGITYQEGNHTVTIYINNIEAATGSWSQQLPYVIRNDPDQKLQNQFLNDGDNKIQIMVAGNDPTNKYDRVLFDYLKIRYFRLYRASKDAIDFSRPTDYPNGIYHFKIDNFTVPDIAVYKIGKSRLQDFAVEYSTRTKSYSILVEDQIYDENTFYFAASENGILKPESVHPDTIFNVVQEETPTDLIIITDPKWKHSLSKLVRFYNEIKISTKIVSVRDIYNEINDGIISPYAIREYLKIIHETWRYKPEYVLLIGDAAIKEEESVPAFFFQSYKYGASAADYWYTVFDEKTHISEFAIGRWPVSSEEELESIIEKRISYTNSIPVDSWKNETLFIAGYEQQFKQQSENLIKRQIPKEFSANRIYIDQTPERTPFWGGSDTLIQLFNNGLTLVNFFGHGGGAVWADNSLFTTSHIPLLKNLDRLPFVTSMTCFTGDFANMTGLGEDMVLAENGGSIGLWGASTVGWIKNDYLLVKPFYDAIFTEGITVGQAIQYAKLKYLTELEYFDYLRPSMVYCYNLIGDPTVQIPFPENQTTLTLNESNPAPEQEITLSGIMPFEQGDIYIQLYDSSTYRVYPEPLHQQFTNGIVSQNFSLPANLRPGNTFINYYYLNADRTHDGHGVTLFSTQGLNFFGFAAQPEHPVKNQPFYVSIRTEVTDVNSMTCEVDTLTTSEYLDENGIEHIISFTDADQLISVPMIHDPESSDRWISESPLTAGTSGKLIGFRFTARDNLQNPTESQIFSLKIHQDPDFYPTSISQGGSKFPELTVKVNYVGDDTLTLNSNFYRLQNNQKIYFGSQLFTLFPNHDASFSLPCLLGQDISYFQVVLDPENKYIESNESNNKLIDSIYVQTFPVLPDLGSTVTGTTNDTIEFGNFALFIEPHSTTDSSIVSLSSKELSAGSTQPGFSLVRSEESDFIPSYTVSIPELADTLLKPMWIRITPGAIDSNTTGKLSIGRWDSFLKIWLLLKTSEDNSRFIAPTSKPGDFTLLTCQDSEPPKIELSIDGHQFFQNSYVSQKPNISIIGEDQNGVLFDSKGLRVKLDSDVINFSELNLPDTLSSGTYVSAQFRPELEYGEHAIEVSLSDAAGNIASKEVIFIVSDELKLIDYGNYPNPFISQTVFIYELTQRVDNFKIKIFTVSGRLIKVLEEATIYGSGVDINEGGYHEIVWDGLDTEGNFIANGIYFYKMIAKKRDKSVTSIGKVAKAR